MSLEKDLKTARRVINYLYKKDVNFIVGEPSHYDFNGIDLVIAADWDDLPEKLYEFVDNLQGVEARYYDEVDYCSGCGKVVKIKPDYPDESQYIICYEAGELLCRECIEEEPEDYIFELMNQNDRACHFWSRELIKKAGFRCIGSEGGSCEVFYNGFHAGDNDTPEKILENFKEEFGFEIDEKFDYLWFIEYSDPFTVKFSLWVREKEND